MCVCALHCAQLLHTILHRTDLIIFPLDDVYLREGAAPSNPWSVYISVLNIRE